MVMCQTVSLLALHLCKLSWAIRHLVSAANLHNFQVTDLDEIL